MGVTTAATAEMLATSPFTFAESPEDPATTPAVAVGTAENLESAINGAWAYSRYTETLVTIYDRRDGEPVTLAEVGVRWLGGEDA